jgi:UDP-N-acetylmuramate dehydrogenase
MMAALKTPSAVGEIRQDEPMSKHTSWRVGGPAEVFFKPSGVEDLSTFLRDLHPDVPVFWFSLGSNLLVRDGGIAGVVIAAAGIFTSLEKIADYKVRVGSSVPCTQLARQCIRWNMGPSEFFAGIPGAVGGALAMNAGAHGGETWERVRAVTTIDRRGEIRRRTPGDFRIAYRSVVGPKSEWFIDAELEFEPDVRPSMETLKAMLSRRKETQPLGLPSCGSVFRNPPGDHAARLIESAGLKGFRVGGAEVSAKLANFIINRDLASAADIEALINHVKQTVRQLSGIELQHEVRIVGEAAK